MTNEQINELSQPFVELFTEMEDRVLRKIAEQLAYDGDLSDTSKWRIRQLARAGLLDKETLKIIREYTGIQSDMLDNILQMAALNELDYVDAAAQAAIAQSLIDDAVVPPAAETAQNAMRSFYRQAMIDTNAVNTVMRYKAKQAYVNAVNNAFFTAQEAQKVHNALGAGTAAVVTGAESLQTAVRDTIKQLSEDGIPAFVDKSGREWTPEAYVRMDIRTTAANTARQAQFDRCEQYNIKLIQVDSHRGARPLCAPYQGGIYSLDGTSGSCEDGSGKKIDYTPLSATSYGQAAGLFGINCGHHQYPFVPGINMRRYFPTEDLEENSREYKQFQRQRALERGIRKSKRECMMLDASGNSDSEEFKRASAKLKEKRKRYKDYCEETGLRQHNDRTRVYGYDKSVSAKASAANRAKMASVGSNDWSKTIPQTYSKNELDEITAYAKERGIKLYQPQTFDGDMEMLREQIDTISGIKNEYNINQKITLRFTNMHDDDFAETINNTICFNNKAMRNRLITNQNLNADNQLAATDFTGIAVHEMGHIISARYGEKGLDIARKAYYNIFNENLSNDDILKYLSVNVSVYSTDVSLMSKKPKYKEITPEILSKSKSASSSDFANEFIRLLKEACL